ncbi:saccharopine dehydrogenase [Saccharopolyspora sp. MS10]|uniref:saccharopine dehydrogenase n=1 Tax=Saccharopolyspora sp. MS10 TaxID=3385973 RepID=UPI0039A1E1C4
MSTGPAPHLWLRNEDAPTEHRTPLTPGDAGELVAAGIAVTVEESGRRAFPAAEYAAAGCRLAPTGSWPRCAAETVVLGLKEPAGTRELRHRHVFFGHAYKGQAGAGRLLARFAAGGGELLDLESLVDESGRRVAAFGYWAGYLGAALAARHRAGTRTAPLRSTSRSEVDERVRGCAPGARALVIGALGRAGRGACDALALAGADITRWDLAETRVVDREQVLAHELLVNAVASDRPAPPFVTADDLPRTDRRLSVISDVTCDVTSDHNRLPVNAQVTDWAEPVRRLRADPPLDVIAIDNLPSLVPREASAAFSADLLAHLRTVFTGAPVWERCAEEFRAALRGPVGGGNR